MMIAVFMILTQHISTLSRIVTHTLSTVSFVSATAALLCLQTYNGGVLTYYYNCSLWLTSLSQWLIGRWLTLG